MQQESQKSKIEIETKQSFITQDFSSTPRKSKKKEETTAAGSSKQDPAQKISVS